MLGAKLAVPWYAAVTECEPAVSDETVMDTLPFESIPVPTAVAPSRILTVPVGVPEFDVTLPVKTTVSPYAEGFREEVRVVVVTL